MLNILIPMAGESSFFSPSNGVTHPKPFYEVKGKPIIELALEYLNKIEIKKRFIFIINENDSLKYKLDNVLKMLTNKDSKVVIQKEKTRGAVCSALLALNYIGKKDQLLISNYDQILSHDINKIIYFFNNKNIDGGVVCFQSVHPHWSYAEIINNDKLIQVEEKRPISKNAIAGLYYFSKGEDFIECSKKIIMNSRSYSGNFYISTTFNEMVLKNKKLKVYKINTNEYHSFYSIKKIKEFEKSKNVPK